MKNAMLRAILVPLALALALSACSAISTAGHDAVASAAKVAAATDTAAAAATPLAVKKYTMAQVKKHHTKSSCWSVVGTNVYKLTKWISKHPGGKSRIIGMCGKNATAKFRNAHGTGGKANAKLAKYKIGVLA